MDTAHKTDEEKKEFFDTPEELEKKVEELANYVKNSKYFVAFTGAGISTSAGIRDFRSGVNTVLPTGPGVWEKAANKDKVNNKNYVSKPMISAVPTKSHMALVKLMQENILKYLVSQNIDGVHRKSGIPANKIAEVHGNTNLEICKNEKCKRQFLRDFNVRKASNKALEHITDRKCESCGKDLYDSIINFGENLPEKELTNGFAECLKADLCLILGSSLRVNPAAQMPLGCMATGGKLVIVNLQKTSYDENALKINAMIDDVMVLLMKKLDLPIPSFTLKRRIMISKKNVALAGQKKTVPQFYLRGVDEEGVPFSLFKNISIQFSHGKEFFTRTKEPFTANLSKTDLMQGKASIQLTFFGHYQEPDFKFDLDLTTLEMGVPKFYSFEYSLETKKWSNFEEFKLK